MPIPHEDKIGFAFMLTLACYQGINKSQNSVRVETLEGKIRIWKVFLEINGSKAGLKKFSLNNLQLTQLWQQPKALTNIVCPPFLAWNLVVVVTRVEAQWAKIRKK